MSPITVQRTTDGIIAVGASEKYATPFGSDKTPAPIMFLARLNVDLDMLDFFSCAMKNQHSYVDLAFCLVITLQYSGGLTSTMYSGTRELTVLERRTKVAAADLDRVFGGENALAVPSDNNAINMTFILVAV